MVTPVRRRNTAPVMMRVRNPMTRVEFGEFSWSWVRKVVDGFVVVGVGRAGLWVRPETPCQSAIVDESEGRRGDKRERG